MTNLIDQQPVLDGLRSDQTLRRMWEESIKLATRSRTLTAEADAAASEAESHERTAATHRQAENAARTVADASLAEALDLVDIVNEKRATAGLRPLTAGEPYDPPAETEPQPVAGQATAGPPLDVSGDPLAIPANRIGEPAPLPGQDGGA